MKNAWFLWASGIKDYLYYISSRRRNNARFCMYKWQFNSISHNLDNKFYTFIIHNKPLSILQNHTQSGHSVVEMGYNKNWTRSPGHGVVNLQVKLGPQLACTISQPRAIINHSAIWPKTFIAHPQRENRCTCVGKCSNSTTIMGLSFINGIYSLRRRSVIKRMAKMQPFTLRAVL